jgi:hypothetical protein
MSPVQLKSAEGCLWDWLHQEMEKNYLKKNYKKKRLLSKAEDLKY